MGWGKEVAINIGCQILLLDYYCKSNQPIQTDYNELKKNLKAEAKIKLVLRQVELDVTDSCCLRICVHLSVLLGCSPVRSYKTHTARGTTASQTGKV